MRFSWNHPKLFFYVVSVPVSILDVYLMCEITFEKGRGGMGSGLVRIVGFFASELQDSLVIAER